MSATYGEYILCTNLRCCTCTCYGSFHLYFLDEGFLLYTLCNIIWKRIKTPTPTTQKKKSIVDHDMLLLFLDKGAKLYLLDFDLSILSLHLMKGPRIIYNLHHMHKCTFIYVYTAQSPLSHEWWSPYIGWLDLDSFAWFSKKVHKLEAVLLHSCLFYLNPNHLVIPLDQQCGEQNKRTQNKEMERHNNHIIETS